MSLLSLAHVSIGVIAGVTISHSEFLYKSSAYFFRCKKTPATDIQTSFPGNMTSCINHTSQIQAFVKSSVFDPAMSKSSTYKHKMT